MQPFVPKVLEEPSFLEIRDIYQHVLVLQGKTLIAVPEDEMVNPITLMSTPCRDESLDKGKGNPIYLGIADHELCLCCAESGGEPILKLEDEDIMELYHSQNTEKSFVFYHNNNGMFSTFESAAYPGWFTCSSRENGKPLMMTKDNGRDGINFYFNSRN
ncbi:interleukin-36 alpha-like [Petaurus breviceps papuanus]|uniref:interleukin-36 alpha-like n=1 Tax=Petaurus breviceps papuanus TaxID=3040969 RepID=UPI0036DAA8BB